MGLRRFAPDYDLWLRCRRWRRPQRQRVDGLFEQMEPLGVSLSFQLQPLMEFSQMKPLRERVPGRPTLRLLLLLRRRLLRLSVLLDLLLP